MTNFQRVGMGLCFVCGLLLTVLLGNYWSAQDAVRAQTAECVAKTAEYNMYSGNVHSQEAWDLFVSECE